MVRCCILALAANTDKYTDRLMVVQTEQSSYITRRERHCCKVTAANVRQTNVEAPTWLARIDATAMHVPDSGFCLSYGLAFALSALTRRIFVLVVDSALVLGPASSQTPGTRPTILPGSLAIFRWHRDCCVPEVPATISSSVPSLLIAAYTFSAFHGLCRHVC